VTFLWPVFLWSALLVPALIGVYLWSLRRRQKYALKFSNLTLIRQAASKGPGFRRHIPPALMIAALGVLGLALSRPAAFVPLLSNGGLIVLAMDSSGSMRAQDVAPSRIEAAQSAAKAFIEHQPDGARMAIVSFAASASLVLPPTDDKGALKAAIDRLFTQRGTAIGSGIVTAMNAILEDVGEPPLPLAPPPPPGSGGGGVFGDGGFGPQAAPPPLPTSPGEPLESDVIVLLSDGRSNVGPDPLDVVPLAAQRKVRIYTVGLGDPNGVLLQAFGRRARVTLDEPTLQAIADKTKADYFRAGTDTDLRSIYEKLSSHLVIKQEKVELTALLAGFAILLLLASGGLSLFWFNRLP